jgi:Asp-tRNA(Asn)/Glu-tRNA(Gln) amidotransferase A subunit family amidase
MMLPLGQSETGFPIAVQLVAPYGDEAALIRLGSQLEAARPWFDRKPPVAV